MESLKPFGIALVSFLVLDFAWIGVIMKNFNMKQLADIGRIENGQFNVLFPAAIPVYFIMAFLVVGFVLPRFTQTSSLGQVALWGALMGFAVYGVYDLTNLAILKNYPLPFAIVDMAWGTFAFAAVSVITHKFAN